MLKRCLILITLQLFRTSLTPTQTAKPSVRDQYDQTLLFIPDL